MAHSNATLHNGTDQGITVCRGESGRLYPDVSTSIHDCEADALEATEDRNTYRHRPTGKLVTIDPGTEHYRD